MPREAHSSAGDEGLMSLTFEEASSNLAAIRPNNAFLHKLQSLIRVWLPAVVKRGACYECAVLSLFEACRTRYAKAGECPCSQCDPELGLQWIEAGLLPLAIALLTNFEDCCSGRRRVTEVTAFLTRIAPLLVRAPPSSVSLIIPRLRFELGSLLYGSYLYAQAGDDATDPRTALWRAPVADGAGSIETVNFSQLSNLAAAADMLAGAQHDIAARDAAAAARDLASMAEALAFARGDALIAAEARSAAESPAVKGKGKSKKGSGHASGKGKGKAAAAPGPPPNAESELQRLRDERLCCVCMDAPAVIAFVPCGHITTCADCHSGLPEPKRCTHCAAPASSALRVYCG